jgi:hypothetical protein
MSELVKGQVYRLNWPSPSLDYTKDGYLWVFLGRRTFAGIKRHVFKSVATGKVDWWPPLWVEAADV